MFRETTYLGMLGSWQTLLGAVGANAELAHLEVNRARLEELLTRGQAAVNRQAALAAAKQETSQDLQAIIKEGERIATVLRFSIKGEYGPRAEKLAEFGLKPFRGRTRKGAAKPSPEAPSPTPAVPTESSR
jgi:hypothetical protein